MFAHIARIGRNVRARRHLNFERCVLGIRNSSLAEETHMKTHTHTQQVHAHIQPVAETTERTEKQRDDRALISFAYSVAHKF